MAACLASNDAAHLVAGLIAPTRLLGRRTVDGDTLTARNELFGNRRFPRRAGLSGTRNKYRSRCTKKQREGIHVPTPPLERAKGSVQARPCVNMLLRVQTKHRARAFLSRIANIRGTFFAHRLMTSRAVTREIFSCCNKWNAQVGFTSTS